MRLFGLLLSAVLGLHAACAIAAELKLFAVGSVTPILRELAPAYERSTGTRLDYATGTSGATLERIRKEPADLGIVSTPLLKELEAAKKVVPGSATVFAKSSAGIATRRGNALDVRTLEALKAAIVKADAIAVVDPKRGSSLGIHMQSVADKLGVGEELRAKLKLYSGGLTVGEAVARGEADFGIGFIPELMAIPNVDVAGPLPAEADYSSLATAVILTGAKEPGAAKAFIQFLLSPDAQKVLRAKGMHPVQVQH